MGDFLDRLGAFVQANLKTCIVASALLTAVAIVLNWQSPAKNSVLVHAVAVCGMVFGTFLMVLAGRRGSADAPAPDLDMREEDPHMERQERHVLDATAQREARAAEAGVTTHP